MRRYQFMFRSAIFICLLVSFDYAFAGYEQHPNAIKLVESLVSEHEFEKSELIELFSKTNKQQSILDAISKPAEKTKPWHEYRKIFMGQKRIDQGVEFWKSNEATLKRASEKYGVPASIIVAIIGVETRYGNFMGKYRVMDALSTLSFDYPKRAKFFTRQLKEFLILAREQGLDPLTLKGSYAGAMGYGQFMPGSYRAYAVDFDGDKKIDIWTNQDDAIGSVANYFKRHRWKAGQPVVARASVKDGYDSSILNKKGKPKLTLTELKARGFAIDDKTIPALDMDTKALALKLKQVKGNEFWLGFQNFYVITRYNHSHLYAMAVWQLSQAIEQAK